MMDDNWVSTGLPALDEIVQGLRAGDNVVWEVDHLELYSYFARAFTKQAVADGRTCVYLRFGAHPPVADFPPEVEVLKLDPTSGFDVFTAQVHEAIEVRGRGVYYVLDNLSSLVEDWATDELLTNFFQVTCPFLYDLETVAYFALARRQHSDRAIARIRDTTQVLIEVFEAQGETCLHPLKMWGRYSSRMFHPHRQVGDGWEPLRQSSEAARVSSAAATDPLVESTRLLAPWDSVYRKLLAYGNDSGEGADESKPEVAALKDAFSTILLGHHPEFQRLSRKYLRTDDLIAIRRRLIGSGRIGGKAAGMLLARAILLAHEKAEGLESVLEPHDSFYIGSDVFFSFLVDNGLFTLRLKLTREGKSTPEEFAAVQKRFLEGSFSPEIIEQFRRMLDYYGQAPIIVRSSSLLEDNFGNAFAGKYQSEFCPNQASPDERLKDFLQAVKLVYASALNPDALAYRRRRDLESSDEQMAILVQRVSGSVYRDYFFPPLAGVAFSRNYYAWSPVLDPEQGVIRLVFGLGTQAVDRVEQDYPRMIAVSHPELRPEAPDLIPHYSQRRFDLINLRDNTFETCEIKESLDALDYPQLHLFVSEWKDGHLSEPVTRFVQSEPATWQLTFNKLLKRTPFCSVMGRMLAVLEEAYGHPVDTEFTAFIDRPDRVRINLLQCRPLHPPGASCPITVPPSVKPDKVLFRASRVITGGDIDDMRVMLFVDPRAYARMEDRQAKQLIGRVVGRLNHHPEIPERSLMLVGPGRWGSSNLDLGINVRYSDISHAAVLVEVAREESGHAPDVSFGTHFFLDLVEESIVYLPVFPDQPESCFNEEFFRDSPNSLARYLPEFAELEDVVKVIDATDIHPDARFHCVADPQGQEGVCFLDRGPRSRD